MKTWYCSKTFQIVITLSISILYPKKEQLKLNGLKTFHSFSSDEIDTLRIHRSAKRFKGVVPMAPFSASALTAVFIIETKWNFRKWTKAKKVRPSNEIYCIIYFCSVRPRVFRPTPPARRIYTVNFLFRHQHRKPPKLDVYWKKLRSVINQISSRSRFLIQIGVNWLKNELFFLATVKRASIFRPLNCRAPPLNLSSCLVISNWKINYRKFTVFIINLIEVWGQFYVVSIV